MKYNVSILQRAQLDIDEIYDWIAKHSPAGAVRWYTAFCEVIAALQQDAYRFSLAPESEVLGLEIRQRLFKTRRGRTYRLLFTIVGSNVRVLPIRGPGQRPIKIHDLA
jgi:plasmid stabilization system protein ParE